jgi:hypothetical protein
MEYSSQEARYEVQVKTGDFGGAGTDCDVLVTLYGEWGTIGELALDNRSDNFERGRNDAFEIQGPHIGPIERIRVRLDSGHFDYAWKLDFIRILKKGTSLNWYFPCWRWLSIVEADAADRAVDLIIERDGKAYPNPDVDHRDPTGGHNIVYPPGIVGPVAYPGSLEIPPNCAFPARDLELWIWDSERADWRKEDDLPSAYDETGYCPDTPLKTVSFEQNVHYQVVIMDSGAAACDPRHPSTPGCQFRVLQLVGGGSDGPPARVIW